MLKLSTEFKYVLHKLSWSLLGGLIGSSLIFFLYAYAGRILGPIPFGKASLIISISQGAYIFFLFGTDSSCLRLLATTDSENKKSIYISTSLFVALLSICVALLLSVFLGERFAGLLSLSMDAYNMVLFMVIVIALKSLLDVFVRGICAFKFQALVRVLDNVFVGLFFLVGAHFLLSKDYRILITSLFFGSLLSIFLYFFKIHRYIKFLSIRKKEIKKVLDFNKLFFVYSVFNLGIFISDKIIVNKYLGEYWLGIYSSYYIVSISLVAILSSIIANVTFVYIIKNDDKRKVVSIVHKIVGYGIFPFAVSLWVFICAGIRLFGRQYLIDYKLVTLFMLLSVCYLIASLYIQIIASCSREVFFRVLLLLIFRVALFSIFILKLNSLALLSVSTLLICLIVNYILDILGQIYIIKRYISISINDKL